MYEVIDEEYINVDIVNGDKDMDAFLGEDTGEQDKGKIAKEYAVDVPVLRSDKDADKTIYAQKIITGSIRKRR